jgi:hypothetical protein
VIALVLLGVLACASRKEPAPVTIKGRVEYADKKPVAGMVLIFNPEDDTSRGRVPSFVLDKEGRFQDRILPGRYRATLAAIPAGVAGGGAAGPAAAPGGKPAASDPRDSLRPYRNPQQTPWKVVIPEQGAEELVLTVE